MPSNASLPAWRNATALLNPHERLVVAHHEMGHALVAQALPNTDPAQDFHYSAWHRRTRLYHPASDRGSLSDDQAELENKMAVLLGRTGSGNLVFGEITTGASDDLDKATDIARNMVTTATVCNDKLGQMTEEERRHSFWAKPAQHWSVTTARKQLSGNRLCNPWSFTDPGTRQGPYGADNVSPCSWNRVRNNCCGEQETLAQRITGAGFKQVEMDGPHSPK